jgi:hypothetical protein
MAQYAVKPFANIRRFDIFAEWSRLTARDIKQRARRQDSSEPWWEHLASDEEFERKIIRRMGEPFYKEVFQPAIRQAWDADKDYEEIRDLMRAPWNALLEPEQAPIAE